MEKLQLDDFLTYNALSALRLNTIGDAAAYIAYTADPEANGYTSELYCLDLASGANTRRSDSGKVKSFCWQGGELVFAETDAPDDDRPMGQTRLYRLADQGTAANVATLPGLMTLEGTLPDDTLVLTRVDDLTAQQAIKGLSTEEANARLLALKAEDEVCTVFDEYPFWFNAKGVINKKRKALYLCGKDGSNLRRISPEGFRVMNVCVDAAHGRVAYDGCMVAPVETYLSGVYVWSNDATSCLLAEGVYHVDYLAWWDDELVICGSQMDHYSCAQCPDLLAVNALTGASRLLCDYTAEINVGNPVGSDCRMGGGQAIRACGDYLYFITGVADAAHLWRCDRQGKMESVIAKDGSIDLFDVQGGNLCFVAMHDMRLQEIYACPIAAPEHIVRKSSWNDDFYLEKPPITPVPLQFINADGVSIHGFVLTPEGHVPGEKTPVILDIHGGPHLSYGAVYYHEMQYWAAKGYYVIYCNPRGGEGRGNEFGYICGRFGSIDFDDLMAFCDEALAAYPDMDAAHMGVTGGSYGGFMTNWVIGHTDRFAAAASQRSISNFISMEGTSDIGTLFAERQILARTHDGVDHMWDQSPLKYADRCVTPTLFIHSEQDYRCWMVEALQMYTALINRGVPTRLCLFHGENHELSRGGRPKGRIRRLTEITAWMDKYLRGT